ncbi:MAG TPA: glycyl-radical enzyme activating protein [bacterium]|nr:glycyl-radical enzyme activating protein [bacterium]
MQGVIFDIQHYAVYDGPGIRTLVFFKGCPLRCAWCHNPESWRREPEMGYLADKCLACAQCVAACPQRALTLIDGWVARNKEICTVCGKCADVCPQQAMETIGRSATVEEIVATVAADKPFYDNSGGGATLSGGEPTGQPDFLFALIEKLRAAHIHIALETCGCFPANIRDRLCDAVDLFLFDIKKISSDEHRRWTDLGNELIRDNFLVLHHLVGSVRVLPRIPLIPTVNDDPTEAAAIVALLQQARYEGEVHLMPYNCLAKTKWAKIGRGDDFHDFGLLSKETIAAFSAVFTAAGYTVVCN